MNYEICIYIAQAAVFRTKWWCLTVLPCTTDDTVNLVDADKGVSTVTVFIQSNVRNFNFNLGFHFSIVLLL